MSRWIEKAGIPTVVCGSFPDIGQNNGVLRFVRAFGLPYPFSTPYVGLEQEKAQRRALLLKCLDVLQLTPTKPTVYWADLGNCIGDQESAGQLEDVGTKAWNA